MMCGECRGLVAYGAIWCERTVRVCLRVRVCSERPPQAPVCGEWACGRERERRVCTWCYNVECVCETESGDGGPGRRRGSGPDSSVVRRRSRVADAFSLNAYRLHSRTLLQQHARGSRTVLNASLGRLERQINKTR